MTVATEVDERIPHVVEPNDYAEIYLRVAQVDDRLIVFRYRYGHISSLAPRCVARTPSGERCDAELPYCASSAIQIVGTDATVTAHISPLPADCFMRQRCPAHVNADGEDAIRPEWESFDPERHAGALQYLVPRWSPKGVWTPAEPFWGQAPNVRHSPTCPFGDHVPMAIEQDYLLEDEGIDPDDLVHRNQVAEKRARWAALIGDHLPDLAVLLGPVDASPADEADPSSIPLPLPPASEPITADAEECQSGPTALYRYFDADDLLLYIGVSDRLRIRTGDHIAGSSWMDFAVRSTIERHPTRAVALETEESAIKAEHPLFNHQHNDTPEARRRLVEYLVSHDRLDLLVPAVSRG
jgi:hypothetical protein